MIDRPKIMLDHANMLAHADVADNRVCPINKALVLIEKCTHYVNTSRCTKRLGLPPFVLSR
jgi:hypothetical protein